VGEADGEGGGLENGQGVQLTRVSSTMAINTFGCLLFTVWLLLQHNDRRQETCAAQNLTGS
jgi:hypothetical protein